MKYIITFLALVIATGVIFAQPFNLNPDPEGEPHWAGGVPERTPESHSKYLTYPLLVLSDTSANTTLPYRIDNSSEKYMRPIFNQSNSSCAQAAGIGYVYTHEINKLRNLPADNDSLIHNQDPTHFTYNFLNNGSGFQGSFYDEGWDLIKDNGCPTIEEYGGLYLHKNNSTCKTGLKESIYTPFMSMAC